MKDLLRESKANEPGAVSRPTRGIALSRAQAIDRVFRGTLMTLVGMVGLGFGVAGPSYVLSYVLGVGGCVVAGVGLGLLGAASRHFVRFGSDRVAVGLAAAAGLGSSLALWGLTGLAPVLADLPILWRLNLPALGAVLGFAAFIALIMIGALVRWVMASDVSQDEDSVPEGLPQGPRLGTEETLRVDFMEARTGYVL